MDKHYQVNVISVTL